MFFFNALDPIAVRATVRDLRIDKRFFDQAAYSFCLFRLHSYQQDFAEHVKFTYRAVTNPNSAAIKTNGQQQLNDIGIIFNTGEISLQLIVMHLDLNSFGPDG